jgi:murein DD-endopeptidase MepM/ murein hydrolase activator NlpD
VFDALVVAVAALLPLVRPPVAVAARPSLSVSIAARAVQPGELVVVSIRMPAGAPAPSVSAFGRSIPAFPAGPSEWRALVGIDLDVAPGAYRLTVKSTPASGARPSTTVLRVQPKKFPVRSLEVDAAFVNPPPEVKARIAAEAAELRRLFAKASAERLWSEGFAAPVAEPPNSRFGSRSIFNGEPRSPHSGADFPSPAGAPVHAPNAGRVVLARSLYFSGNTVVLDHGLGLFSLLAHLESMEVREGDPVERGAVIGLVGATGRVTGPHLHWAVRLGEARVDPVSLLALLGEK